MTFQIRQDDRVPEMNIDVKIKNDSGISFALFSSPLFLFIARPIQKSLGRFKTQSGMAVRPIRADAVKYMDLTQK